MLSTTTFIGMITENIDSSFLNAAALRPQMKYVFLEFISRKSICIAVQSFSLIKGSSD